MPPRFVTLGAPPRSPNTLLGAHQMNNFLHFTFGTIGIICFISYFSIRARAAYVYWFKSNNIDEATVNWFQIALGRSSFMWLFIGGLFIGLAKYFE